MRLIVAGASHSGDLKRGKGNLFDELSYFVQAQIFQPFTSVRKGRF
jgi:hypothetical protein